jgi:hypothetical protein
LPNSTAVSLLRPISAEQNQIQGFPRVGMQNEGVMFINIQEREGSDPVSWFSNDLVYLARKSANPAEKRLGCPREFLDEKCETLKDVTLFTSIISAYLCKNTVDKDLGDRLRHDSLWNRSK